MDEKKPMDMTSPIPATAQKEQLRCWRELPAVDPFLVVISGAEKGKKILLISAATSIGRSVQCNIQLNDPRASRNHAEIIREPGGFFLCDLGSANGSWVNGSRADRRKLRNGDHIIIGSTEMVLTIPSPPDETCG